MKKLVFVLIIFLVLIISFSVLIETEKFFLNIISTLNLWLFKVYPSVFTFYCISSLLLNTNILNKFIYYTRFFFKKLRFQDQRTLNLFILSIFTGNPSSSGLIVESIEKSELTINNANKLLKCSSFQNPLFILGFLFPYSIKYAFVIIFVHILSNLIITLVTNRKKDHTIIENASLKFQLKDILKSINNVIYLLLIISSMMVFANIIIFSMHTVINYLGFNNLYIGLILSQFEISRGLKFILELDLDKIIVYLLVCFTVAFNGLSIHLQVYNIISKYNLKYKLFFFYRIVQGFISICLFIVFIFIEKSLF